MGRVGSSGGAQYLRGLEEVQARLNAELSVIKAKSEVGLLKAAAFIRYETEHTTPLTPRDIGNLVASWFITSASKIVAGQGADFKGPKASELSAGHYSTMSEALGTVKAKSTSFRRFIIMGYSANYAGFIHEMVGAVNFHRPGSDAKWLEAHLKKNVDQIVLIVKTNTTIK
jgi:hypothetical protein